MRDGAITSLEIDRPRPPAGIDPVPYLQRFILAVPVMHDDALKLDRGAINLNLERAESPVATANLDPVMIH
jgi:hypothetical protein